MTEGIYIVRYYAYLDDHWENTKADLIFLDDKPYAVLAWSGKVDNQSPQTIVELDSNLLTEMVQDGHLSYIYAGQIQNPDQAH